MKNIINNHNQNPYCEVINQDFNKWNSIKTSEEFQSWKNNIPKLGTYGTINIKEFIDNHKKELIITSEFNLKCYLNEME